MLLAVVGVAAMENAPAMGIAAVARERGKIHRPCQETVPNTSRAGVVEALAFAPDAKDLAASSHLTATKSEERNA